MKYQILWLTEDKTLYSNYAKNIKELKKLVNLFMKNILKYENYPN